MSQQVTDKITCPHCQREGEFEMPDVFENMEGYEFRAVYGYNNFKERIMILRKCKVGRKTMPLCECELLKGHAGEEGCVRLIHELMIEDYADAQGHPIEVFDDVWSFKKGLTEPEYEHAVERYCKFMDEVDTKTSFTLDRKIKDYLRTIT